MTIIVALKDKEEDCVWLSCDTQGTAGDSIKYFGSKIFSLKVPVLNTEEDDGSDEFVTLNIGVSGSHYLASYLNHSFNPPSIDTRWDFISYLYNQFFQQLQEELSLHKLLKDDNGALDSEASLLIVYNGEIYNVYNDFSIMKENEDYSCMGSGWSIGEAILCNLLKYHKDIGCERMVEETMSTVAEKNIYCNDEVLIKKIQ